MIAGAPLVAPDAPAFAAAVEARIASAEGWLTGAVPRGTRSAPCP